MLFKRYPYTGWLLFALLLGGVLAYRSYQNRQLLTPRAMMRTVSEDLQNREHALEKLMEQPELFKKMFSGKLSADEAADLADAPFYVYAFEDDVLVFWNSNTVIGTCPRDSFVNGSSSIFRENGTYLKRCFRLPFLETNKYIVVLFPIVYNYPFENDYLHSHFAAADYIPVSTQVFEKKDTGSFTVRNSKAQPAFFLRFKADDIPAYFNDSFVLAGVLLAVIVSITWINLIAVALSRRKKPVYGLAVVAAVIVLFRTITYAFGYPFHLGELTIFSPTLYASSKFLPSLGDLIINLLCLLWLIIFTFSYFPKLRFVNKAADKKGYVLAAIFICALCACSMLPANVIRSLVLDSGISYDVSHFYSISAYTVVGIFTIALIACSMALIIYLVNIQYSALIKNKWLRYALLMIAGAIIFLIKWKNAELYEYYAFGWLLLFIILLDIGFLKKTVGLFAPNMIFWAAFISIFSTVALQYFASQKEQSNRRIFADRLVNQRDNVMEYLFPEIAERISHDRFLRGFIDSPAADIRTVIEEHLGTTYLRGQLNRYDTRLYIFDRQQRYLYNSDTTHFSDIDAVTKTSLPVNNYLFYRDNVRDAHYYLASIPVFNDSNKVMGHVFIDMMLKKAANETVYPELLQPGRFRNEISNQEYSYGIYVDRQLVTQTNDYPFPIYLHDDTIKPGTIKTIKHGDNVELWYKASKDRSIVILHKHSTWLEIITLFSYLLGVMILFALVTFLFRIYFHYVIRENPSQKIVQLTLRKRIHFAMLGIVLVSFLIIGSVTIWFFVRSYNDTNKAKLQAAMQALDRSIQQYLKDRNVTPDEFSFDAETDEPQFKAFVNNLANSQSIDINVYNSYGLLKATSQEDIYNKAILARIMMPDAYYRLSQQGRTLWVQDEHIGKLNYLSCYVPLRYETGQTLGFINVPFFASQRELNFQISNVLVALINLYAFVFLLSSLFAVLITNWLTRTLQVIISKFERFNLRKNELLEWKYDDEIGLLIKEYNKMVMKVEENATLLAQSEREGAWREMARQVAHEIKNPLTPMKLNIQYLQQALKNDYPNVRQLTENVSESLIEQIDNLSHIASAFSDFAKMPEALPEEINLNDLLSKACELYINNSRVQVTFKIAPDPLMVYADRSQLLRVITNLLQNAVEAIPDDRSGNIVVELNRENSHALVTIADNGSGIPAEIIDKIFSPYFTTKGSGTGLGLAMTKRIIEFWKGSIWFETTQNEGTTFYIRLPLITE